MVICLSGRGDKDVAAIARYKGVEIMNKIESVFANAKGIYSFYNSRGSITGSHGR